MDKWINVYLPQPPQPGFTLCILLIIGDVSDVGAFLATAILASLIARICLTCDGIELLLFEITIFIFLENIL